MIMHRIKRKIGLILGILLFCWLIISCNETRPDDDVYDDIENPEDENPEDEDPGSDERENADFSDSDFEQKDIRYSAQGGLEMSNHKEANATFDGEFKFKWDEPFDSDFIGVYMIFKDEEDRNREKIFEKIDNIIFKNRPEKLNFGFAYKNDKDTIVSDIKRVEFKSILYEGFPEKFEDEGEKTTYAAEEVEIGSGKWLFDYWQIGTAKADRKHGERSARSFHSRGGSDDSRKAILEPLFDFPLGISKLVFEHAVTSSDNDSQFVVQISDDEGCRCSKTH